MYYDRVSAFDTPKKRNDDKRKLNRLVLNKTLVKLKFIAGGGTYVKMTRINTSLLFFLILTFLFLLFLYDHSNNYFYFYGVKIPEVKDIFL